MIGWLQNATARMAAWRRDHHGKYVLLCGVLVLTEIALMVAMVGAEARR